MASLSDTLWQSLVLLSSLDSQVGQVVGLSLRVSLLATLLGAVVALPLGAWLALARFPGRGLVVAAFNAMMGLPSVVVGVVVYLLLSRSGPFGGWGLLFSPPAMMAAQWLLVTPLMAALVRQTLEDGHGQYALRLASWGYGPLRSARVVLWDCRFSLLTAVLAGLGRALSEVGAVMMVGGNINHQTRVMTTAIALETGKGDLPLALALGMVLLGLILLLNGAAQGVLRWAMVRHGK